MAGETLLPSVPGQTDATIAAKYYEENTGSDAGLSDVNPQPALGLGQRSKTQRDESLEAMHCF